MLIDLTLYFEEKIKLEDIIEKLDAAGIKYSSVKRSSNKPLPPKLKQAKSLIKATTQHVVSGMKQAEDYDMRIEMCNKCDSMRDDGRCAECGCFMSVKARWAEQPCPLNKWREV